jgi:pimeloyl-ACP methyl ester carboxylesterase
VALHGHISVRGHRLEYQTWARPDVSSSVPAILLLHEGLGSVSAWRGFPDHLAERTGCRVFAYSRRGYGSSDTIALPRDVRFMHEEAIDELPHVLAALDLERPILLGHSDGGSIALIFAAQYSQHTRALVLEAPHVFVEDLSIESIARMKVAYEATDLRSKLARFHGDNIDAAFRGWNDVWLHPDFRDWNIEAYLPHVRCPALVIQGEDDEYGTLAQVEAIRRQVSGRVRACILKNAGHAPHHRQRGPVLDEIDRFLRTLPT